MRKSWLLLFFFLTSTAKAQEIYSLKKQIAASKLIGNPRFTFCFGGIILPDSDH